MGKLKLNFIEIKQVPSDKLISYIAKLNEETEKIISNHLIDYTSNNKIILLKEINTLLTKAIFFSDRKKIDEIVYKALNNDNKTKYLLQYHINPESLNKLFKEIESNKYVAYVEGKKIAEIIYLYYDDLIKYKLAELFFPDFEKETKAINKMLKTNKKMNLNKVRGNTKGRLLMLGKLDNSLIKSESNLSLLEISNKNKAMVNGNRKEFDNEYFQSICQFIFFKKYEISEFKACEILILLINFVHKSINFYTTKEEWEIGGSEEDSFSAYCYQRISKLFFR